MNKYHAQPTIIDNIRFASKKEALRYQELLLLQRAGAISHLELQVKFPIVLDGKRICTYIADFVYTDAAGLRHVEDVKSDITRKNALYRLKCKLVEACHHIAIEEV